jgi:hypothetical protein
MGEFLNLGRRVIVGSRNGKSAVVRDDHSRAITARDDGTTSIEIWRVKEIPAPVSSDGTSVGEIPTITAADAASIRLFRIAPARATGGATADELRQSERFYVGTVAAGQAYLVLESDRVLLHTGDSFVMPGSKHTWDNPFDQEAVIVSSAFPLAADGQ